VSVNESNARRATRARKVARLRLLAARICYAECWIIYGFHHLRRADGDASCPEGGSWPRGTTLDRDATGPRRGE
jgi:hypothetical protein